jgi:hypothetical protein
MKIPAFISNILNNGNSQIQYIAPVITVFGSRLIHTSLLMPLLLLTILSCSDVKESDINPEESFNRIYNSQDPEDNIYPVDIIQTTDKGYLVVSEVEERTVSLLKTDEKGNVVSQAIFPELKSPMQGIFKVGEDFYFFCRDELEYAIAVKVNLDSLEQSTQNLLMVNFPLAVGKTSGGFIIQSWNQEDRATIVTRLNETLNTVGSETFNIEEEIDPFINNHIMRKGPRLPFLVGEMAEGQYFFNGYFNNNFNLMFLNSALAATGNVAGYKTERYVTALHTIQSGKFAVTLTATAEDKNYIAPSTDINIRNQSVVSEIPQHQFIPEMSLEIPLTFRKITANGSENILCGFTTKTNQVALYSYDQASGTLNGKHVFGYTNPYELCGFNTTEDGGLVVLSKTQVAGRFPRIAITKFSVEEVNTMFGK